MWDRAFMRLLSLSFTAFFIAELLWRERQPRDAGRKQTERKDQGAPTPSANAD